MNDVTKEQLITVARELNDLMNPKPKLPVRGTKEAILEEIVKASCLLERGDETDLSEEVIETYRKLGIEFLKKVLDYLEVTDTVPNEGRNNMLQEVAVVFELFGVGPEEEPPPEPEPEEPEEEFEDENPPEDDPEPEETVPEEDETVPEEDETVPPPVAETEEQKKSTDPEKRRRSPSVADLSVEQLVDIMRSKVDIRPKKAPRAQYDGPSPYSEGMRILCQEPTITQQELFSRVEKETGYRLRDEKIKSGVRTAYSVVHKVIAMLDEGGFLLVPKAVKEHKKPAAKKKTVAK